MAPITHNPMICLEHDEVTSPSAAAASSALKLGGEAACEALGAEGESFMAETIIIISSLENVQFSSYLSKLLILMICAKIHHKD